MPPLAPLIPIIIQAAVASAISFGLGAIARALTPTPSVDTDAIDASQTINLSLGINEPRQILVGERIVGGQLLFRDSYGPNRSTLVSVIAFSAYECTSFERLFVQGEEVTLSGDPTQGIVNVTSHFLGLNDIPRIRFRLWLGQANGNPGLGQALNTRFPGRFSNDSNGDGMCIGFFEMVNTNDDIDEEEGENFIPFRGVPAVRCQLKGSPVCDLRDPDQNFEDPSTWKYSNNAGVIEGQYQNGWFFNNQYILGADLPDFVRSPEHIKANADYCEQEGFTCDGILVSGQVSDWETIRNTFNGVLVESLISLYTVPQALRSSGGTLDLSLFPRAEVVDFNREGFSTEVHNTTNTIFISPEENFTEKPLPERTNPEFLEAD